MNRKKQRLGVCALGAVLLSAVGTAAAQPNTAYGTGALKNNTTGSYNSAFGYDALYFNTTGAINTAIGEYTLYNNTAGEGNTAIGSDALASNIGSYNSAFGAFALYTSDDGCCNTASGWNALSSNTKGSYNTANGYFALTYNTTGTDNTGTGVDSLTNNTTGYNNTADGDQALYSTTTGYGNTASGLQAGYNNTIGYRNQAFGNRALFNETTGDYNIAIGWQAGFNITSGSDNIEIGAAGSADSDVIRVGTQGTQKATYIAGISGTTVSGADVAVSSTGQLGVVKSSVRYKKDIQSLDNRSQGLWQLRPVTFRYKDDPKGQRQYGLIAEEVAEVYPELVVRGDKGEIESVQYRELIPLMLNEMQNLKAENTKLEARLERLEQAKTIASR